MPLTIHEKYMRRCLDLAIKGASAVAPNPLVGSVLVYDDRIIGEGYHMIYGGPHAEVNCINNVTEKDVHLIKRAVMYVSLEPCAHFGKTPPCADFIISKNIPEVVVGCRDPFSQVNGKGVEKMMAAGIKVTQGILEKECRELNKRFFVFHTLHRPYIILKWAETADKKIGNYGNNRLMITNELTNRLVHQWRSREMSVMVGTNTAMLDDPHLTNRLWTGSNPVRVVVDMNLQLPSSLHLFDASAKTIVFNTIKHSDDGPVMYYQITHDVSLVQQVLNGLYRINITSLMIEGGAKLIQTFIDEEMWDEARVIRNEGLSAAHGVPAPVLTNAELKEEKKILEDSVKFFGQKLHSKNVLDE